VRVLNLALNVVELAGNVFQYAELDTVLTHFAKRGLLLLFFLSSICSDETAISDDCNGSTKDVDH
jgi:hypothetical protein